MSDIKVDKERVNMFIDKANDLESMINFIKDTDDVCLSDIRNLSLIIGLIVETFKLEVDHSTGHHTTRWIRKND